MFDTDIRLEINHYIVTNTNESATKNVLYTHWKYVKVIDIETDTCEIVSSFVTVNVSKTRWATEREKLLGHGSMWSN